MLTGADDMTQTGSLEAAIALLQRPRSSATLEALSEELVRLRRAANLIELEFATVAAAFASEDDEWEGCVSPIQWIRNQCHMTCGAAVNAICVGEQVEVIPKSRDAVTDGRIGFAHLALLAGVAGALRESPTAQGGFDEQPLLRKALRHGLAEFRRDCEHVRHAHDATAFLTEQVEDFESRGLEMSSAESGAMFLKGWLDPEGGAAVRTALDPLARPGGAEDDRSRKQRYADALVELARHGLDAALVPTVASQRPHLQVTTTLATLLGVEGASAGELEFGGTIAAATVQRLACDASVTRVLLGPGSQVLDVGRAHRVPSGPTRRALRARYGGCAWPGCDRPASWTQVHHLVFWARGGPTELDNLVLICNRHHWMVHEGGWQLRKTEDGRILAIAPVPTVAWQRR